MEHLKVYLVMRAERKDAHLSNLKSYRALYPFTFTHTLCVCVRACGGGVCIRACARGTGFEAVTL